jgi:hypothetical protein
MSNVWTHVARSHRIDPRFAASDLVEALPPGFKPKIAILYADVLLDHATLFEELRIELPDTMFVGATSGGASTSGYCTEDARFVAAAFLGGDGLRVRLASVGNAAVDPFAKGVELGRNLTSTGPLPARPYACLVWYSPLHGIDAAAVVAGLESVGVRHVYGGGAGQPWGPMVATHQFADAQVLTDGFVAVILEGVEVVSDSTHGMEAVGVEFTVTRAEGNVIYEFDGRPALTVWGDYFGIDAHDSAESVASWGVGITHQSAEGEKSLITRSAFTNTRSEGSMTLQAAIAQGTVIQLCARTQPAVLDGAKRMGERLVTRLRDRETLLLLSFECAARSSPFLGPVLARQEVLDLQQQLGPEIPWLGMYAWGEVSPVGNETYIHNYTFPLCALCIPR